MNLLLFILSAVGMCLIFVDSHIMERPRKLIKHLLPSEVAKVFECYQCMGFWTGVVSGLILISFNPFVVLCCGCAGSFCSVLSVNITNYLEAQTVLSLGGTDEETAENGGI